MEPVRSGEEDTQMYLAQEDLVRMGLTRKGK